jgi:hypothetical protein
MNPNPMPPEKRVGILTFQQMWGSENTASSRIRAQWLVNYWDRAELFTVGRRYEAVIFQKAYWPEYAALFDGVKILDICDPDFLDWKSAAMRMMDHCDAVTTPTVRLKEFIGRYTDRPVHVVPDRLDLSTVDGLRKIHCGPARTAAWYGYGHNYPALDSMAGHLSPLGITRLIVIAQQDKPYRLPDGCTGIEVVNYAWSAETVNQHLLEADVVVNPRLSHGRWQYKSSNKTVNAWALGLPVAHSAAELAHFLSEEARREEGKRRYDEVRERFDVRQSVDELERVISDVRAGRETRS